MNRLIYNTFIRHPENTADPAVREAYGKTAGIAGIITNTCLFALKFFAGIISGSIAIMADGLNNLSDASSSVITFIGFRLSAKPEDEEHPYGHARIEYITGNIVAVIIVVMGVELFRTSLDKTLHPEAITFSPQIFAIVLISIPVKIWLATFYRYGGSKIHSISLKVSSADCLMDVISTSVALASLLLYRFTEIQVDGPTGILVSMFIMFSGIKMVKETVSPLLGEAPDPNLVKAIKNGVLSYSGILGVHDLSVHSYGPSRTYASIHAEIDASEDLIDSHHLIDCIERELGNRLGIELTIHIDPLDVKNPNLIRFSRDALLITENTPGLSSLHDIQFTKSGNHTDIRFDLTVSSDCKLTTMGIVSEYQKAADKLDGDFRVFIDFDNSCEDF